MKVVALFMGEGILQMEKGMNVIWNALESSHEWFSQGRG